MSDHHPKGPSNFNAWDRCPGWEGSGDGAPSSSSGKRMAKDAKDGIDAHKELERLVLAGVIPHNPKTAPEWAAQFILTHAPTNGVIMCEVRCRYTEWDSLEMDDQVVYFGTFDVSYIRGTVGYLFDFKNIGVHKVYLPQLAGYALAMFDEEAKRGHPLDTIYAYCLTGLNRGVECYVFTRDRAAAKVIPILDEREEFLQVSAVADGDIILGLEKAKHLLNPCEHCTTCKHTNYCPAKVDRAVAVRDDFSGFRKFFLNPEQVDDPVVAGQILDMIGAAAPVLENVKSVIRSKSIEALEADPEHPRFTPKGWKIKKSRTYALIRDSGLDRRKKRIKPPVGQLTAE